MSSTTSLAVTLDGLSIAIAIVGSGASRQLSINISDPLQDPGQPGEATFVPVPDLRAVPVSGSEPVTASQSHRSPPPTATAEASILDESGSLFFAFAAGVQFGSGSELSGRLRLLASRISTLNGFSASDRIRIAHNLGCSDRDAVEAANEGRRYSLASNPRVARPGFFVVLRGANCLLGPAADLDSYRPKYTRVFSKYQNLTANLGEGSVSRGLPTLAELEAYSIGAGIDGIPPEV